MPLRSTTHDETLCRLPAPSRGGWGTLDAHHRDGADWAVIARCHFLGGHRDLGEADAGGVADGVADGGGAGDDRRLADAAHAERPGPRGHLQQDRLDHAAPCRPRAGRSRASCRSCTRPSSSNTIPSYSAQPMPWATPPWIWSSNPAGLIALPTSWMAT